VNGQPIFIRGGGWAPDMMLRFDPALTLDEMRYVRNLGLNTIRLEGKLDDNTFSASPIAKAFWSSPAGAVATSGKNGVNGRRRPSRSPPNRSPARFAACAIIPACSSG